mgnify:CR=1 FL=1
MVPQIGRLLENPNNAAIPWNAKIVVVALCGLDSVHTCVEWDFAGVQVLLFRSKIMDFLACYRSLLYRYNFLLGVVFNSKSQLTHYNLSKVYNIFLIVQIEWELTHLQANIWVLRKIAKSRSFTGNTPISFPSWSASRRGVFGQIYVRLTKYWHHKSLGNPHHFTESRCYLKQLAVPAQRRTGSRVCSLAAFQKAR